MGAKIKIVIWGFVFIVLGSCTSKKGEIKLARVSDKYLYLSDISNIFSAGMNPKDSLLLINNYIENWVKQEAIYKEAENKLSSKEKDFTKQIEDYRNSLVIYNYEKKLIENVDTMVSTDEIEKYYNSNSDNFQLKDNIVKVYYVKVPKSAGDTRKIKDWMNNNSKKELEDYCKKNATNYYLDEESWLLFEDILKEIPIKTYNQEDYLKNNKYIEFKDKDNNYFIRINDFKIKESQSPISFEINNIKKIIINLRKNKIIKDFESEIYKKAMTNNEVKVF